MNNNGCQNIQRTNIRNANGITNAKKMENYKIGFQISVD